MFWYEVTHEHHGRSASVSAKSTPKSPARGEGPFIGQIYCPHPNNLPSLCVGKEYHSFARWWEVEFIND